jgi:hypothetical protein
MVCLSCATSVSDNCPEFRYRPPVHPFRFRVTMSRAASAEAWIATARRAEELGYDTLMTPYHLGGHELLEPRPELSIATPRSNQRKRSPRGRQWGGKSS